MEASEEEEALSLTGKPESNEVPEAAESEENKLSSSSSNRFMNFDQSEVITPDLKQLMLAYSEA